MANSKKKIDKIIDYIVYIPIFISLAVCVGTFILLLVAFISNSGLLEYWEQIAFFILGFAFILKEYTRLYFRKKEIHFQSTQDASVTFINQYLEAFYKFKDAMTNLPLEVFYDNISPSLLDEYTSDHLRYLKSKDLYLRIYLKKDIYNSLNQLTTSSSNLYNELSIIRSHMSRRKIEFRNDLTKIYLESVKANDKYECSLKKFNEETANILDNINFILGEQF